MSRNAFVPMSWITSDLNGEALRTLILISTYADARTGECWPNNATLAEVLGKTQRSIQTSLQELKSAGFISMTDAVGRRRRIRIESPEWFDKPRRKPSGLNHEENLRGSDEEPRRKPSPNHEGNLHPNHEGNLHPPNKNTPIEQIQEHSSGGFSQESKPVENATTTTTEKILEPFESDLANRLPGVRNGVERFRHRTIEIRPTQFEPKTRDRMVEVLGIDSDHFARKVTQDQADAGFVDWIMNEVAKNKTPGRLAFHLLKTAWRDGWIDPKAEEEAKRAARRKRLEALK